MKLTVSSVIASEAYNNPNKQSWTVVGHENNEDFTIKKMLSFVSNISPNHSLEPKDIFDLFSINPDECTFISIVAVTMPKNVNMQPQPKQFTISIGDNVSFKTAQFQLTACSGFSEKVMISELSVSQDEDHVSLTILVGQQ